MNSDTNAATDQKKPQKELIVTLQVQEGNKPGKPVGSYELNRRTSCLVFLPSDAPIGQKVRVRLVDTGAKDRRSNPLFTGIPALVEYKDQWKDNGDGTANRITVAKNWLLQEWEEGECEHRTLAKDSPKPDRAVKTVRHTVDFSTSLVMATVIEEMVVTTPLMSEKVDNTIPGGLVWVETGKNEVVEKSDIFAVSRIGNINDQFQCNKLIQRVWDNDWTVRLPLFLTKDGSEILVTASAPWGKLPAWTQFVLQTEWPICSCGRERVALAQGHKVDEYSKCSKCRSEEHCQHCTKQVRVNFLSGRLICDDCKLYETAEQLIVSEVTTARKVAVAAEAGKLLAGQAISAELGFLILKASLGHVVDGWRKEDVLSRWGGYQWYYFTDMGVFGSKFSPATLQIFQFFNKAVGDGLVEMTAWLSDGPKADIDRDFFLKTQVKGENITLPDIEGAIQRLAHNKPVLADYLRGSESSRLKAIEAIKSLDAFEGDEFRRSTIREARELLGSDAQDYAAVIAKVAEAKRLTPPPPPKAESRRMRDRSTHQGADLGSWSQSTGSSGSFGTAIGDLLGGTDLDSFKPKK